MEIEKERGGAGVAPKTGVGIQGNYLLGNTVEVLIAPKHNNGWEMQSTLHRRGRTFEKSRKKNHR